MRTLAVKVYVKGNISACVGEENANLNIDVEVNVKVNVHVNVEVNSKNNV
jgi:putative salt-induced outer membrane protein YdiY